MPVYYPQGVITLRVLLEDFGEKTNTKLQNLHTFSVVARTLKVHLNDYTEADTFEASLDYKVFPFDPRTIRSCGVTIHVEDREKLFKTNNALNLIKPTDESTIFIGYADTDRIRLSEDTRMVTLEGRDFTSLLLDQEYLGNPIQVSKPLDQVIRGLLDEIPQTKIVGANSGLVIDNQTGQTLPSLGEFAPDFNDGAGAKNGRPRRTYWDMIQALVEKAGLISYVSLDTLVITKPRNLYDRAQAKHFIYGHNVKEMEFERKLGRQKGFNIRVVSLNIEKKTVIEARIPEEATESWASDIGITRTKIQIPTINPDGSKGEPKDAPYITFRVRDVSNKDQLVEIGQKIFEEVGRQQIEGKLTTHEMEICDVKNNAFDATKFRVGTPIELSIDQGDLKGLPNLTKDPNPGIRKSKIKRFLIERCYDPKIAEAFAESLTKFDTPFFTKAVEFTLDQENGWSMNLDFINFIELPPNLR